MDIVISLLQALQYILLGRIRLYILWRQVISIMTPIRISSSLIMTLIIFFVFVSNGNGSFANQTMSSIGTNPYCVVVGDFDNDFILDIIVANHGSNDIVLLHGDGYGSFVRMQAIQLKYKSHPIALFVADFNNDKKLDFVVANNGTQSYQVFLQTC